MIIDIRKDVPDFLAYIRQRVKEHLAISQKQKKPKLRFTRFQLKELVERMLPLTKSEMARLPGMERRR